MMFLRAIHFITRKINNNKGLSLIEVIISAAVLVIISVPVVTGFTAVAIDQMRARHMYVSTLLAESLLTEVRGELDKTPIDDDFFTAYAGKINSLIDLLPKFVHDEYLCTVAIKEDESGEIYFFTEDMQLNDISIVETGNISIDMNVLDIAEPYNYTVTSGGAITILPNVVKTPHILCETSTDTIHITNQSGYPVVLHIFGNKPQVLYDSDSTLTPLLIQYFENGYSTRSNSLHISVTISVYDRGYKLLKRMGTKW